jgi:predicted DNA binding CopG/RHH family protein
MKTKLSKEEKEILESFEKGEWVPVADFSKRKKELMEYARNTLRKDKRLNIRISERDLVELQRKAVKEGLPYQTYVSSIIHKFVNGTLVEAEKMNGQRIRIDRESAAIHDLIQGLDEPAGI